MHVVHSLTPNSHPAALWPTPRCSRSDPCCSSGRLAAALTSGTVASTAHGAPGATFNGEVAGKEHADVRAWH